MAPDYAWPATPDVSARVLERIEGRPRRRWLPALIAAAVLLPAATATAVSGDIQAWLGIKGVEVRVGPPPQNVPTPDPGRPVSLAEARRIAGFAAVLPPALGTPDAVRAEPGVITLRYGDLRLYEVKGVLLEKGVDGFAQVRKVPGGAFFEGRHFFLFQEPDGTVREGRTAQSTLILARGDRLLRLEGGDLTLQRAQRLLSP